MKRLSNADVDTIVVAFCCIVQTGYYDTHFHLKQIAKLARVCKPMHVRLWRVVFFCCAAAQQWFPSSEWKKCRYFNVMSLECTLLALHHRFVATEPCLNAGGRRPGRFQRATMPFCPPPATLNEFLCWLPPFPEERSLSAVVGDVVRWNVSLISNPEFIAWFCARGSKEVEHLSTKTDRAIWAPRLAQLENMPREAVYVALLEMAIVLPLILRDVAHWPILRPAVEPGITAWLALLALRNFQMAYGCPDWTHSGRFELLRIGVLVGSVLGCLAAPRLLLYSAIAHRILYRRERLRGRIGHAEIAIPRWDSITMSTIAYSIDFIGELTYALMVWMELTITNVLFFGVSLLLMSLSAHQHLQTRRHIIAMESYHPYLPDEEDAAEQQHTTISPFHPFKMDARRQQQLRTTGIISWVIIIVGLVKLVFNL